VFGVQGANDCNSHYYKLWKIRKTPVFFIYRQDFGSYRLPSSIVTYNTALLYNEEHAMKESQNYIFIDALEAYHNGSNLNNLIRTGSI